MQNFNIEFYQPPAAKKAGDKPVEELPFDIVSHASEEIEETTTLEVLRKELLAVGVLDSKDVFRVYQSKASIPQTQEAKRKIEDVCKPQDDAERQKGLVIAVVRCKADDVIIPSPGDLPKPPDIKPDPLKPDEEDHVSKRTGRGTDGVETKDGVLYAALSDKDKAQLLDQCNAFRGVLFKDGQLAWSFRQPIEAGNTPWNKVIARTPQETYINNEFFTFDKAAARFRQSATGSLSGGFKAFGYGVAAELSGGWAREKSGAKTTIYGYSETLVPKIEFRLNPATSDLAKDFVAELEAFATCTNEAKAGESQDSSYAGVLDGTKFTDYEALRRFFEKWGAYIPLEFVVGGKLFSTDSTVIESSAEAYKWQASFRLAAKSAFSSVNVAAQYSQDEAKQEEHQAKTAFLQAVGGDPGLAISPAKWVASIGAAARWRTCHISRLVPVYEFCSEKIKTNIYKILNNWADYWREDPVMLSFDDYVLPLERCGLLKWADNEVKKIETPPKAVPKNSNRKSGKSAILKKAEQELKKLTSKILH